MARTPSTRPLEAAWGPLTAERLAPLLAPPARALPRAPLAGRPDGPGAGAVSGRAPWEQLRHDALSALVERADAHRGRHWPQPTASTWARVHRDGDRVVHEDLVFTHTHRLARAVLAAAALPADHPHLDDHLDEVADGLLLRCEQSSWCWPAHDDAHRRTGALVPDVLDPPLDLGAGEVAGQLAWTDHLLGGRLDARWPGLRQRVRLEVRRRVLDPFVARRDWPWAGLTGDVHNWNPWIHGNVLAAALVLLDGEGQGSLRAHVVALVLEGLDRYVAALPDDGATDEGFDYWFDGACRALEALELVRGATGGALDWTAVPRLRATTGFPSALHLGGAWHASFADSRARAPEGLPWHALHAAARRAGDAAAAAHAAATAAALAVPSAGGSARQGQPLLDERAGLPRVARALADPSWWQALAAPPSAPLAGSAWLPSVQVLVVRRTAGSAHGLSLAVKGGHDDEHHNHCDVGSVVVALGGVPVVVDPGRPTYTGRTFGPHRYEAWTVRSAWHSVPVLRGTEQGVGRRFAARDVERVGEDEGLALDLAPAHPRCGVRTWRRTARLERASGVVVLTDAWELDAEPPPAAGPSAVHLVLAGAVHREEGGVLVQALDGAGAVRLRWEGDVVAASLEERRLDDPVLTAVWGEGLTRLRLELPDAPVGGVRVTASAVSGR